MDVSIVPCSVGDVEPLRLIARETYDQAFGSMNSTATMEKYLAEAFRREKLVTELSNPQSRFFFLYTDQQLSGYLKLNEAPAQSDYNDPESLEIERIYVRREFQGQGLGRVLVDYSARMARQLGKHSLWLGVWEKNAGAIAFYIRMGFAVSGRHSFRMGNEIQQDFVMKKVLAEEMPERPEGILTRIDSDADRLEVISVLRESFATVAREFNLSEENAPTNPAFVTEEGLREYLKKPVELYGLVRGPRMIGCVAIEPSRSQPGTYYIERLAVVPEKRHHGYGDFLLSFAERRIAQRGGSTVSIGIMNENTKLKEWYRGKGFQEVSLKSFSHLPFHVCFMTKDTSTQG